MLTRVVGKGRVEPFELARDERFTIVDVGTGDGHYAYALAGDHPDARVIAFDALDEPMGEIAHKALRKPAKGGRANVVFLRAAIEALPNALHDIANDVRVILPWGKLLEGIVLGEADVITGISALAHRGARIEIILNGEIWIESTPVRYEHLPVPTPEHVATVVAPAFADAGITLEPARVVGADDAKAIPSTWARKLGHGRNHPTFISVIGSA